MAAPETHIPLASLPRLADTGGLLNMLLGSAGLVLLLGMDVWHSGTKRTHWIPGDSFVLGALTLQLLGNVFRPVENFSGGRKLNRKLVEEQFENIHSNQLLLLGRRLVICVFIGISLPTVAQSRKSNRLHDILALCIAATTELVTISYDIYIVVMNNWINNLGFKWDNGTVWLLVSNILIFCSVVLLVLFLCCAALASKSIQDVVDRRISVLLSPEACHDSELVCPWERVGEQVVRSWITGRTYQPDYVIVRSVLSSSIGFLVTVCVVVSVAATAKNGYMNHLLDWRRVIAVALQWIFILSGWAIVLWRWVTAVVYYPRLTGRNAFCFSEYFRVEDFWKRAILELKEKFMNRFLHRFVLSFFFGLQILLILTSKTCWLISEMVFSHRCLRRLFMFSTSQNELLKHSRIGGPGNSDNCGVRVPENPNDPVEEMPGHGGVGSGSRFPEDFERYSEFLMYMQGENLSAVWIANEKSITEMKDQQSKGKIHGGECTELIALLARRTQQDLVSTDPFAISSRRMLQVERDFEVGNCSTKMSVVSLLTVMVELSTLYRRNGGSSDRPATDTVKECIKGCSDAWKILEFEDISDPKASLVSKHANRLFLSLKESSPSWLGQIFPINKPEPNLSAKRALQGLAEKGRETAYQGRIRTTGYDSNDWKAVIAGNSLYKVCENNQNGSDNMEEMLDEIKISLANVIWNCVLKVKRIIMKDCMSWAEDFMDERISRALNVVGMAQGISESRPRGNGSST